MQCLKCKGRGFCGRDVCPHYLKSQARFRVQHVLDRETFFGTSPAPFVGRVGYPFVNVGILSPAMQVDDAAIYDAPRHWAREDFKIPQIVDLRSSLINSRFTAHVRERDKFLEISQEVGMANKPVEVEIELEKKPVFSTSYDNSLAPMGPNASLKSAKITANPRISHEVDYVVDDSGLKAQEALLYLHKKGHDENFLSKLLSVGTIGIQYQRRLVPTRWSITAVDDFLSREALKEIKTYPQEDNLFFYGNYLGNYYLIMFFSDKWSYELFETYLPKASWNLSTEPAFMTDYEGFNGRKNYAEDCAGGYYACRNAITEEMKERRKQASVLALRFITGEYAAPLGVWVCREATRKAMQSKPIEFQEQKTMIDYVKSLVIRKFGYDIAKILSESKLLREGKEQTKLSRFL